jgi:ABC-type antimicrobial peptide transport system permease subunit
MVKMKKGASGQDRETIMNGLRNFIDDDLVQVVNTPSLVSSTDTALELLTIFFNVISVVAVALCFFVLWLSFTANVNENAWEFGVLRSVGLKVPTFFLIIVCSFVFLSLSCF